MQYENYPSFHIADDLSIFDFYSIGKHGKLTKRIVFMRTDTPGVYNLAFGDIDQKGEMDDVTISDNGDRNKILATVAKAVDEYTRRYPRRWIVFKGSTNDRARLYRMAIGLNLEQLSIKFHIYGLKGEEFVPFQRNMHATAFLVKRKFCNFMLMKKRSEKSTSFFDRKVTLVVDEKLNRLKGKVLAPRKLAEANELLSKVKSLPK
jgi:hypothetical protein